MERRVLGQKWLDTEAALAKAQGELGVIPKDKADVINEYAKAELLDIPSIGEFYKSSITIVPLLRAFKAVLPDHAGEFVHWGATSQDIVDTGMVLLERDAYQVILRDMKACLKPVSLSRRSIAPPDGRPYARCPRCADHLRLQGRCLG